MFPLLTRASTQLGREFGGNISSLFLVILRWSLCSFGISNLTASPIRQNELFMEKNNPCVLDSDLFFFFFSPSWFDFALVYLKLLGEKHHFLLSSAVFFPLLYCNCVSICPSSLILSSCFVKLMVNVSY